jgi:predicted amidohydrolase YtcJ
VYAFVPLEQWGALAARVAARGYAHPKGRLFVGGVKAFADGSLGSRTALMHEDYSDAPGQRGRRMIELGALRAGAAAADAAGLQVAVHAIGDRAVDDVLDVFEAVEAGNKLPRRRPFRRGAPAPPLRALRVEHAQHISGPAAAARLGSLAGAVVAVANPQHLASDGAMLAPRLGPARAAPKRAFAWPTLMAAGAAVAAGSDWPVVDMAPPEGLAAAAARLAGPGGDGGARAARDALRMHTAVAADAAYIMGAPLGRLVPRSKADFVVLDRSPLEGGPEGLAAARVVRTYVDGRCAHGCGGGGGGRGGAGAGTGAAT